MPDVVIIGACSIGFAVSRNTSLIVVYALVNLNSIPRMKIKYLKAVINKCILIAVVSPFLVLVIAKIMFIIILLGEFYVFHLQLQCICYVCLLRVVPTKKKMLFLVQHNEKMMPNKKREKHN